MPEPDVARYCAPYRCYCGRAVCDAVVGPVEPITQTVIDINAIKSGKRRASLAEYREAQAYRDVTGTTETEPRGGQR